MRRQLVGSIHAGESVTRQAERLLDIGSPIVRLPRHVEELRDAARMALHQGDQNHYFRAVDKWRSTVERLGQGANRTAGEFSIRSATQQLVKDLGAAKLHQVDEIVDRWVVERARYQARMVARSEAAEAFRDVYKQTNSAQPYVVGYRWTPSGSHPKPDVCDVLASQDLDGLGPGGYKPDNTPTTPHPHCMCTLVAIIDSGYFKRELAKVKGEEEPPRPWESGKRETGQDWVARQPEAYQKRLLGTTRFTALKAGQHVIDQKGRLKSVQEITGSPKRPLRFGQAVPAKAAILRDRQGQVRPFPRVPPVPKGPSKPPPTGAAPGGGLAPLRIAGSSSGGRKPPSERPSVQQARARIQARTEAKLGQTPEYWLEQGLEAKYGTEVGKAIAHGRAVEHQGRAVPIKEAKAGLLDLEKASVHVLYKGELPIDRAERDAKRTFGTLGDAIAHYEQQGRNVLANQLRGSAALLGHSRAIDPRTRPIELPEPTIVSGSLTAAEARRAMADARRFFEKMGDKSLVHPERFAFTADAEHPRGLFDATGRRIVIGEGTATKVVHEWGHAIEELNPAAGRRARQYLAHRIKGYPRERLIDILDRGGRTWSDHFEDDEYAVEDEWLDAYMGKDYGGHFTEITSYSTALLVRRRADVPLPDVHLQLALDPDSFYFVLGQLAGAP